MSNPNYTLEIISHHPKFDSKSLRKYYVDGIDTVGVWGNEPFEIRFKNHSWQKVQVKLSLDGTDILTGKPADTNVSKDMWVVNGYGTLSLKAWPETNNGGAAFVFTSADNSVAVHTHGDLSSRGIIAAAVFTEGHVEPIRITTDHHHHHWHSYPTYIPYTSPLCPDITIGGPTWVYTNNQTAGSNIGGTRSRGISESLGGSFTSNSIYTSSCADTKSAASFDCMNISDAAPASANLEELVSIGAGEHVDQKITYVAGLIKPVFSEAVRVKYLWWDDLVAKLRTQTAAQPQPSGFPGDVKQKNIDLKCTPRIGEKRGVFRRTENYYQQQAFDRF